MVLCSMPVKKMNSALRHKTLHEINPLCGLSVFTIMERNLEKSNNRYLKNVLPKMFAQYFNDIPKAIP